MIKANLPNATRHTAILGLKRPACSAALVAFCATLGLGSAVAVADTFNVSTAAEFQAALNEAAVNGQDDTIILAAGTYSTAGNLSFTYTREETEGAPYVSDYGIMTEAPPDHAPFVYRHRFDDDVAGYSTCPKSGGQVCTEPYSLTITGAGEGATILDGGGESRVLAFMLAYARPPEPAFSYGNNTTTYDHGGLMLEPDWRADGNTGFIYVSSSTEDTCESADDQPCNELMATLPEGIGDSGVLITVSDLTIQNGLYIQDPSSNVRNQDENWMGCYYLHPSANSGPSFDNAWPNADCVASGLSLSSRNASLRLANVTFSDNVSDETDGDGYYEITAALVVETLGGDITLDRAVFLGNRNLQKNRYGDQYGGAASLMSRVGDITVNDSVFGDGTAEGANSLESGSEGGALRAMVGPALEWDTYDFRSSWKLALRDDIDALNEARYSEFIDAANNGRSGELFPSDMAIGGKITVTGSSFLGNVIVDSSETTTHEKTGYGGGASLISHYGSRGVTVSDSVFTGNTSPSKGGGLAIEAKSGTVLIEGSTFTDNFAGDQGGGVYVNSEVLVTIRNNTVTDNTVDGVSTTEQGIGDETGYCRWGCEGGGIFARGAVSLIQNTITGNTITPNGGGSDGMGGGAAILAAGTPGAKLEIHRNHIGNNTTRFGTGGLYVISKHHDVTLTSNFIHDNTNTENVNGSLWNSDDSMRVGGGVSVRSQTGTINFVSNTVANNTMVHDRPSDADDNISDNSFYNYPSGGVYLSVEANEAKNWRGTDNHPNYRHDLPTGFGEYLVGPAQANVYNNNFWNNTVIDASGGLAATTRNPPNGGLVDLVLDNLTAYDDTEFRSPADTGSVVNVFNNNFSTPDNYYISCDPETMTCQQLAGANISVDPLFQDDDGDASQMEESSDGLTGETGLSGAYDPNAPDQPEVDFFGNPVGGIGALWERLAELIPVPVMGNLGLALLGLLLMVFGVRRLRADAAA